MPTYVDTSALLRLIEQSGEVGAVRAAMAEQPMSSNLAELECWASIHKRWHDGALDETARDWLIGLATETLRAVNILGLSDEVHLEARALSARHPLRTLDALHLATAAIAQRRLASRLPFRFCTADRQQAKAARHHFGEAAVDLVPPL